ncbi:MAG: type IV pilus assembly protein PilM [bacterium]|nr:type IV pilus assembly protein PilM [bacterium]
MKPFSFPSLGIDISDESFKYIRLESIKGSRQIKFFGEKKLEKGIVEEGEIKDVKALSKTLLSTLKTYHSKSPYVVLSLPEEKGFLRLISMQTIPLSEVRQALEFQLEEHIPFPPDQLVFDYKVMGKNSKGEMHVVLTAYPKALVYSYMEVIKNAGFIPIIFELESQAVARAVVPRGLEGAVLVGDIGKTRTTFSIVHKGMTHFTSTIKVGGRDIDETLKSSLHINEEEASEIKIGRGLDIGSEDVIKSLASTLNILKDEAERQIGFWDRQEGNKGQDISRVFLCGGDAHLRGLPEFLSRELQVDVERAKIWDNIFDMKNYIPPVSAHDTLLYATALGLALRGDDYLFRE